MISTAPLTDSARSMDSFTVMGIRITPKVAAIETNGQFSTIEELVPPGVGVPPNIGHNEMRIYYVVDGEFELLLGNVSRRATAGDTLIVPAGAINGFTSVGASPGKLLATFAPAGHEEFLRELSEALQGEPPPEEIMSLSMRYGVEMAG